MFFIACTEFGWVSHHLLRVDVRRRDGERRGHNKRDRVHCLLLGRRLDLT
jgi:hypothetical protein